MAYIDKELFKQDIKMRYCNNCARPNEIKCRACSIDDMLGEIEDAPTADVEEVKHGKWEFINQAENYLEPPTGDMCKCSKCNFKIDVSETLFKYCPNCGAKMDLEDDEE